VLQVLKHDRKQLTVIKQQLNNPYTRMTPPITHWAADIKQVTKPAIKATVNTSTVQTLTYKINMLNNTSN